MKINFSVFLLLTLSAAAFAADKYVSREFGFAAAFPSETVRTQITSDSASFLASAPSGAWDAQIKVFRNVTLPRKMTEQVMEEKLSGVLKDGGMVRIGSSSYTTFQGKPALLAKASFIRQTLVTGSYIPYTVVVDLKLVFVAEQSRIYLIDGLAIQDADRAGIQPFLDSFELR